MTTGLEQQFFSTFGIEPKVITEPRYSLNVEHYEVTVKEYPQITDRILLELICILASNPIHILFESMLSGIKEVELLKISILLTCIANKNTIKHHVRTLFEEG